MMAFMFVLAVTLRILALICFLLAAFKVSWQRVNFGWLGLASWLASTIYAAFAAGR